MTGDEHREDGMWDLTRRVFFKAGVGLVGACYAGAIGYPVYRYLATPAKLSAALAAIKEVVIPHEQLPPLGTALRFAFGTRPALLIHLQDDTYVCFDAVCTHLGCTVEFQPDQKWIHCACHGGTYDMTTGKNIAGPPPKPLTQYKVEIADGQFVVTRA